MFQRCRETVVVFRSYEGESICGTNSICECLDTWTVLSTARVVLGLNRIEVHIRQFDQIDFKPRILLHVVCEPF